MKKFTLPAFMQIKSSLGIRLQAMAWLVMGLLMIVLLILLWMYGKAADSIEVGKVSDAERSIATVDAINLSKKIDKLDDLSDDVEPIKFETIIRDLRDYPDEFKDKVYLKDRSNKWTVQIMNVANHETITDYLNSRKDRKKFIYFRFTDQDNKSRYMLAYDEFSSLEKAMEIVNEIDFGLPSSVQIAPEEMNRYISMVDNYERAEEVLDMSRNRPRSVILKRTRREVPAKPVYSNTYNKSKRTFSNARKSSTTNNWSNTGLTRNSVNRSINLETNKKLEGTMESPQTFSEIEQKQKTKQKTDKIHTEPKNISDAKSKPFQPKIESDKKSLNSQKSTQKSQNDSKIVKEPVPQPFVPDSPPN